MIVPQPLHDHPQLVGQLAVLPRRARHREELSGVVLQQENYLSKIFDSRHLEGNYCS